MQGSFHVCVWMCRVCTCALVVAQFNMCAPSCVVCVCHNNKSAKLHVVVALWSHGLNELKYLARTRVHSPQQTQFSTPLGESPWLNAQCVTKPQSGAFPDSERWIKLAKWNTCMCRWWEFLSHCICVFICICTQTRSGRLVPTQSAWEEQSLLVSV